MKNSLSLTAGVLPFEIVEKTGCKMLVPNFSAKILKMDPADEDAVWLQVAGFTLYCFVSYLGHVVHEGQVYPVRLELWVEDDYEIQKSPTMKVEFHHVDGTFEYHITGFLNEASLEAGITFHDPNFLLHYGYLDQEWVRVRVDRIQVEFEAGDTVELEPYQAPHPAIEL